MPKVIAYQSKFDKRVYGLEQRDKYIIHLQKIRQKNTDNRKTERALNEFEEFRNEAADSLSTIEEIEQWIIDNMSQISYSSIALSPKDRGNLPINTEMLNIKFENMRYDTCVNNSHNAPRSGVTNWHNVDDKPRGYPGVRGTIHMLTDTNEDNVSCIDISTILKKLGICTGSGGSGNYFKEADGVYSQRCHRFDVILFDSDWPCLAVTRKMIS